MMSGSIRSTSGELPTTNQPADESLCKPDDSEQRMIGDWLLTYDASTERFPMRTAERPWSTVVQAGGWTLWQTGTGDGWRGMPQLAVDHDDWCAWLTGELYGTLDPAQEIREVLDGHKSADALNGHFLVLAWNRSNCEWHVWANRHATLHAYVGENGSRLAVGTFFPSVAVAVGRKELDWEGLSTFFAFGYFAQDRTHIRGVRTLRPATHLRFGADGQLIDESHYWAWQFEPDMTRSYSDTVDEFAERFGAVMDDLTSSGRIAVPISGGLDSRTTVATFPAGQKRADLWAYSYGYGASSVETTIARRVAAARKLKFDAYTIGPYLFAQLPEITAAVEGFEDITQCRQAAVHHEIDEHADFLIAAHLGDLYLADMGLIGADGISEDDLAAVAMKKVRKGGSDWLLDYVCRPNLGQVPGPVLHESVTSELARLHTITEPDFRIKAFKIDQWCARWTTVALRMYMPGAFPRLPFYDLRMADFFRTVPTQMVSGRRLQIDYLRRYAPDLARITWQATGRSLMDERRAPLADLASRAVSRGVRTLRGQRLAERNWEIQFAGAQGEKGLHEWLLRPGLLLHDYIEPRVIGELLSAFHSSPYVNKRGYTVAMLLSFSGWLETHYRAIVGEA